MPETREQIIERMARRAFETANGFTEFKDEFEGSAANQWLSVASSALPVAVKAVTDRVRELHRPVEVEPSPSTTICADCSWQLPNGRFFGKVIEWPCPTVLLLDQIDAELGGE